MDWMPTERIRTDGLDPWAARAMLGLLDREPDLASGDPLPLGWHWIYFKEALRSSELGPDGHESRGGFLPPVDLPRRMWAGGRLTHHRPVFLGQPAELRSEVVSVTEKEGRTGPLTFVIVRHRVFQGDLCVDEEQTLVYRGLDSGRASGPAPAASESPPERVLWSEEVVPTRVALFQFSALTYNAHRIHYDYPYVTESEGYADLVVHGPLTALMLLDGAERNSPGLSELRYRALSPLLVDRPVTLRGRVPSPGSENGAAQVVEAVSDDGRLAMRGQVS